MYADQVLLYIVAGLSKSKVARRQLIVEVIEKLIVLGNWLRYAVICDLLIVNSVSVAYG